MRFDFVPELLALGGRRYGCSPIGQASIKVLIYRRGSATFSNWKTTDMVILSGSGIYWLTGVGIAQLLRFTQRHSCSVFNHARMRTELRVVELFKLVKAKQICSTARCP